MTIILAYLLGLATGIVTLALCVAASDDPLPPSRRDYPDLRQRPQSAPPMQPPPMQLPRVSRVRGNAGGRPLLALRPTTRAARKESA